MFDIEADGPVPHMYSMVSFGVVKCKDPKQTFYGEVRPITNQWVPEALAISNISREQHLAYPPPQVTMDAFLAWTDIHNEKGTKPVLVSDNSAWDYQWINYYLWRYCQKNPFGHSARNINDVFHGMKKNMQASFKYLRKTPHTHNPVDDSMGNVEALHAMIDMGLKVKL